MRIVHNPNGTIDFSATREVWLGNPSEDSLEEDGLLEDFAPAKEEEDSESVYVDANEFWSDPCWAQPPGIMG